MRRPGRWFAATAALSAATLAFAAGSVGGKNLWSTQDQRGQRLMEEGRYAEAAATFADPLRQGIASFRAGDFKQAAQTFGGLDTAEAAYNQGTALIMLGKYDEAVARFDRALVLHPGWADAQANRTLALARGERMRQTGGEAGDQREGADQFVYEKDKKDAQGQQTEVAGTAMSDEAVRALWLKRVQTRPADFLRSRFAYQLQASKP